MSEESTESAVTARYLGSDGEVDAFPIRAPEGRSIAVRVAARSLGSPLDPVLRVVSASGEQLAEEDDARQSRDPEATVKVPRASGTVMLVVDASNSMTATDLEPSRLGAAQRAATEFARAQPDSVDIGVVVFGQTALNTQVPTDNHEEAVAAINRLKPGGGTSLGQAILAALSAIVGEPVALPAEGEEPKSLGYWRSATMLRSGPATSAARCAAGRRST